MFSHKGVLLILDGLGDRPVQELGGRTPLEAASTPSMDRLAASGLCGFVAHVAPGIPVGTQTGSGLLLGMAPSDVSRLSRGLVQAVGVGIALEPGDVALRCNFATLEWCASGVRILDRRAGRIASGTAMLADAVAGLNVDDGVQCLVKSSTQHRVALVLRGDGLSDSVTDTDPGAGEEEAGLLVCRPLDNGDPAAVRTASIVNAFLKRSHEVLNDHPVNLQRIAQGLLPANGFITRGAGQIAKLRNLIHHLQIKTTVISGEGTVHGLARLFGFGSVHRPGFTATTDTDLQGKISAVIHALDENDLVILHIKGPDVCAHDRDPVRKKAFIEVIDAALEPLLAMDLVVGITADHSTDSTMGRHTGDPVPSLLAARHIRKDDVQVFGESSCMKGGLGCLSPTAFLCSMLDQMNRMHNFRPHEIVFFK